MAIEHVFDGAHAHVADWPKGRWHTGIAEPHSSQALCVSVLGALSVYPARNAIVAEILKIAGLRLGTPDDAKITCEAGQDRSLAHLLNETGGNATPTCVDALIEWPETFITVESKLSERSFGRCSQVAEHVDKRPGAPEGTGIAVPAACDGTYGIGSDRKTNTRAPCRLQTWDGTRAPRLYWQIAWDLFRAEVLVPDGRRCPFSGPSFQLMRNLALARAAASPYSRRLQPDQPPVVMTREWGLLVAHVGGHPAARGHRRELAEFKGLLLPDVRDRVGLVTYEQISDVLRRHQLGRLATWVDQRIAACTSVA